MVGKAFERERINEMGIKETLADSVLQRFSSDEAFVISRQVAQFAKD